MHAVDHGDLASAEVIGLSVGHGDLHVVARECRQGRHRGRFQDNHLSTTADDRFMPCHAMQCHPAMQCNASTRKDGIVSVDSRNQVEGIAITRDRTRAT